MKFIYIGLYGCGVHGHRFTVGKPYFTPTDRVSNFKVNGWAHDNNIWLVDEFGHTGLHEIKYFKTQKQIRNEKLEQLGI